MPPAASKRWKLCEHLGSIVIVSPRPPTQTCGQCVREGRPRCYSPML